MHYRSIAMQCIKLDALQCILSVVAPIQSALNNLLILDPVSLYYINLDTVWIDLNVIYIDLNASQHKYIYIKDNFHLPYLLGKGPK